MEFNRKKITNPDELDINIRIQTQEATIEDFLQKANLHFEKDEFDLAIENFSKVIVANTTSVEAYYGRALAYHQSKQIDLALKDYAQVLKLEPEHAECFFNRGIAHYTKENYEIAIFDFTKAISITKDPDFYYNRALAYEKLQKYHDAISDLTMVINATTFAERELFKRANLYLKTRQLAPAKQDFEAVKVMNSTRDRECDLLLLAYLEEEQRRQQGTTQTQTQNFTWRQEETARAEAEARAKAQAEEVRRQAEVAARQATQIAPLKAQAEQALIFGQYQDVIQLCNQILQTAPDDYQTYIYRGSAYLKTGNRELSNTDFAKACSLDGRAVKEIAALGLTNLAANWLKKLL